MIAADTNIALRLVLNDDPQQVEAVRASMMQQRLFLSLSVILETGWVLASRYRMPRAQLADMLDALLVLEGVEVARAELVHWAVDRFRSGADWADMIHLVAASKVGGFLTFDRHLARDAGMGAPTVVETLA